jgi:hypothetical protein
MEHRYDIVFRLALHHTVYEDNPVPGFTLQPTATCQRQMARHGMLFRSDSRGGFVAIEKIVLPDQTAQVVRPPLATTHFDFWIVQRNAALLARTVPFKNGLPTPGVLTQRFMLCFDNLNRAVGELTEGTVSSTQAHFIYPSEMLVPLTPTVRKVSVMPVQPGARAYDITPDGPEARQIKVALPDGVYRIALGTAPAEAALVQSGIPEYAIGLVRLFRTTDTPEKYTITFATAAS